MPFTPKALGDGFIPDAVETIFTATANRATYVKEFTLLNESTTTQTILIYVNRTGENRQWKRFELQQNEAADVLTDGQTMLLEEGDTIVAVTTSTDAVHYTLSGVEETD